jgi:hypothetical protein
MSAGQPPKSRAERRSGAVRECPQLPARAPWIGHVEGTGMRNCARPIWPERASSIAMPARRPAGRGFSVRVPLSAGPERATSVSAARWAGTRSGRQQVCTTRACRGAAIVSARVHLDRKMGVQGVAVPRFRPSVLLEGRQRAQLTQLELATLAEEAARAARQPVSKGDPPRNGRGASARGRTGSELGSGASTVRRRPTFLRWLGCSGFAPLALLDVDPAAPLSRRCAWQRV